MRAPERQAGLPPAVVIHGRSHALAALAPGLPVLLLSAPGAAAYAGAGWWRAMITGALQGRTQPDAIDCADLAGRALEALAVGCRILVLHPCPARPAIIARAALYPGARLLPARPPALDLAAPGAARHLASWLDRR